MISIFGKSDSGAYRAAWIVGEQVFRLAIGLVVSVGIARMLGPHDFGRLSYAISVASILGVASTLGFNRILVREFVADRGSSAWTLLQSAVLIRLLVAILLNLVVVNALWLSESSEIALISCFTLCFLFGAFDCIELYYQANLGTTGLIKARLTSFVVVSLVRLLMIGLGGSVEAFALLGLLEAACGALAILFYTRRESEGLTFERARIGQGVGILRESWPEIVAGFSGLMFMRMDQIMLEHISGAVDVGYFAVATRLSELWYFLPSGIVAAVYPTLLASKVKSKDDYFRHIRRLMGNLIVLSYFSIFVVSLCGEWVIGLVYGVDYLPAVDILVIHVWCGIFVIMAMVSGMWIVAERLIFRNMLRNIFGAAINFVLNLILIPHYGAKGAVWATLVSFVFAYFIYDFFDPAMRRMGVLKLQSIFLWDFVLWLTRRLKGA